jgi:hypothetical protein
MTTSSPPRPKINGEALRWRMLANNRPIAVAVLAGIIATHIATIFGFWFHGLGLPNLDWPRFNGYLLFRAALGNDPAVVTAVPDGLRLILGWIAHSFTGVVFALVFAVGIHPRLPWRNTTGGNMGKALVWGGVLATLSALWWAPVLFPEFGLGFFTWNLDGFKGVLAIYLWHAIWAVHLGLIYNPLPDGELAITTVS